ncbi:MAG: acyl carrier protein [Clostridia bacterium]|nr:acyl carrier protein [Clostridia bacterium]
MEKLLEIMSEIRPDVDFTTETQLIDGNILDSLDIISIVSEVNDAFDLEINVNDLVPENFNSAQALYQLIEKLLNS